MTIQRMYIGSMHISLPKLTLWSCFSTCLQMKWGIEKRTNLSNLYIFLIDIKGFELIIRISSKFYTTTATNDFGNALSEQYTLVWKNYPTSKNTLGRNSVLVSLQIKPMCQWLWLVNLHILINASLVPTQIF